MFSISSLVAVDSFCIFVDGSPNTRYFLFHAHYCIIATTMVYMCPDTYIKLLSVALVYYVTVRCHFPMITTMPACVRALRQTAGRGVFPRPRQSWISHFDLIVGAVGESLTDTGCIHISLKSSKSSTEQFEPEPESVSSRGDRVWQIRLDG